MRACLIACGLVATLALVGACSDDSEQTDGGPDKDAAIDGSGEDSSVDSTVDEGVTADSTVDGLVANPLMGKGCKGQSDCKGLTCITHPSYKTLSVCSATCTPDDTSTPLINEDNCPSGFVCGSFRYTTATYNYCLKKCTPSLKTNPCPADSGTTCDPVSTRWSNLQQPVCFEPACKTNKDCPVLSGKTCVADGDCTSLGTGAFCDTTSGYCAKEGTCSPAGLCGPHTLGKSGATVGDACTSDFDCPNNGRCFIEEASSSTAIGVNYRNGYCTVMNCAFSSSLTEFACPTGATCNQLFYGGMCFKSCKLTDAKTCRNNSSDKGGDYECYAWNNLSIGGVSISKGPVCSSAAAQTCDSLGTQLDCTSLAEKNNPTKMGCADRYTGKAKSGKHDPTGVCLDNTASGPFMAPSPDAGVPDATVPDAGVPDATVPDATVPLPDASSTD